ncbi:VOC family protein [Aureisphaera galaxeae]|uniref:VOC family protein n=1 Tax=Aureisphaera galaxeae TaxID=1538023 RepID=UPI002350DB2C|nr:VOC family protein [Aureisphaera galaxeae]MDC8005323.1 VOC family protein [Aureisphaera galaxeae]
MKGNDFIWTDLATFHLLEAQDFYTKAFGWEYSKIDDNYYFAHDGVRNCSGLYRMPEKYESMGMPSFWMSYISVENLEDTLERARTLGGRIEWSNKDASFGHTALIRDPLGAGFTIYEGTAFQSKTEKTPGTLIWNELFVSSFENVEAFYKGVFQWQLEYEGYDRHFIVSNGRRIGGIQQMSNAIKGKHEYWAVYFATNDLAASRKNILEAGGNILYEGEGMHLYADPFGAMFQLKEV